MAQHRWKSSDFIEVKNKLQRYILRINLSNKTAISSEDSLDPWPEARAGLRQGVPGRGPSPPSSSGSDPWICCETLHWALLQRRPIQNSQKGCRAKSLDLLHPHLRKVLLEPVLHPLAVVSKGTVLMEAAMAISVYLSASFDTIYLFWKYFHSSLSLSWYVRREVHILSGLL